MQVLTKAAEGHQRLEDHKVPGPSRARCLTSPPRYHEALPPQLENSGTVIPTAAFS
jgi:hypothetical protein